ncbi:immune inhibitor A domain-containing protein [Shewanella gelidii]|uniref:Peptidase M6 n=1 Tax=Shewanella gelidii TaxID=1642821 RepID=A0A917JY79_9GAMM|nr:immune inhibitor A domain-containing protein [Shewanella gelidii]MCL1098927.1 immune inhibitor A [Shewanella gelidii]GGI90018.1 peptidase M6 [Shewanella gelidii]
MKKYPVAMGGALGLMLAITGNVGAAPIERTPADAGVINEQQILYWLMKRGELAVDATQVEKAAAIRSFTLHAGATPKAGRLEVEAEKRRLAQIQLEKADKRLSQRATPPGDALIQKTVKVLGILIDFPDLPNNDNRLSVGDTDMYYPSYPINHYRDLLFSTSGFTGPQGQNLQSGYQYFQEESGQTFFFTGDVKGWYRAANNAAFYGGNGSSGDGDVAVETLVQEAVTAAVADMTATELASYDVEDPYDLDSDGNIDEPDGIIDHIMLFHSSIGEEAGGGVLGDDAIWSHRFFINQQDRGYTIPGTSMKAYGYTIQPIDAAAGVCVHEFGHDLGLPDEYDTTNTGDGSPVGLWSLMSGGSWVGALAGTRPSGFSPYARSYLQEKYKGNWIKEQDVELADITNNPTSFSINNAVNHEAGTVNQLSVALPSASIPFEAPISGSYQYYSDQGNLLNNVLNFDVDLPNATPLALEMKAHWNIEQDWDYLQVMVDGVPVAGNHTQAINPRNNSTNYLSGSSSSITGAAAPNNRVDLAYDLSGYAGRNVTISIHYVTDESVSEYGFAVDDILVTQGAATLFSDGAEAANAVSLNGFVRIGSERPGAARRYIVQLRNYQGVDSDLRLMGYEPGVLLWLEDFSNADNNVSVHPGTSLIGVIDADQNMIGSSGTQTQIRDAAFSMNDQTAYANDNHLTAVSRFDDALDYSSPSQPQSGMILSTLGLTMDVIEQATDSSTATVRFNLNGDLPLAATVASSLEGLTARFTSTVSGGEPAYRYSWNFGDGSAVSEQASPSHTYAAAGTYNVTLTVTDSADASVTVTESVTISVLPVAEFSLSTNNLSVEFISTSTGGSSSISSYLWDFGDGNTLTSANASHTYNASGTYTVTLTVTNNDGVQASTSQSVTVYVVPTAGFTASSTDLSLTLTNTSSGGLGSLSYLWDFGDGTGSTAQAPSHTYGAAGTYIVTLTVTDTQNETSTAILTVTVSAPVTPPTTSSSVKSSGGSLGGGILVLLSLLVFRRRWN